MAQVHFHCTTTDHVLMNLSAADVDDLTDAREQALMLVRGLIAEPGPEDWRDWVLHVSDDLGEEVLSLPFATVMGPLH